MVRDGNGYKPTGFSFLRPIPTKEKFPHRVTHLMSWVEVSPQIQTRQVKKNHRVTRLNFLTVCYNKKKYLVTQIFINYEIWCTPSDIKRRSFGTRTRWLGLLGCWELLACFNFSPGTMGTGSGLNKIRPRPANPLDTRFAPLTNLWVQNLT
jgi:hypothetical protein